MEHGAHKYREALELVERHLGQSLTADQIAQVIAEWIRLLQERLEAQKKK